MWCRRRTKIGVVLTSIKGEEVRGCKLPRCYRILQSRLLHVASLDISSTSDYHAPC